MVVALENLGNRAKVRIASPLSAHTLSMAISLVLYTAFFGWYTLQANDVYYSRGSDLAIYDQAVWNTMHGNWFRSTFEEGWDILLADHVEPILLPISLFYFLWPNAGMLLLIQTVALALGALPAYWLARDALQAAVCDSQSSTRGLESARPSSGTNFTLVVRWSALGFALVYLLHPALHSANTFEFHPSALAAPFLLYALYFMRHKQRVPFFLFLLLAMSTKEVIPLTTGLLGLYICFIRREWALGAMTILASVLWFVITVFVIIPHLNAGGQSPYFDGAYRWLGDGGPEIVSQLLTHPGLIWQRLADYTGAAYLTGLLKPVAYIALLDLPILLLAVPNLLLNALSDSSVQHSLASFFHYAAVAVPFVVVAAIDGAALATRHLGRLLNRALSAKEHSTDYRPYVAFVMSLSILIVSIATQRQHGYLPFSRDFYLPSKSEREEATREIVRQIPSAGSLSTDLYPDPYLSHREDYYNYPALHDADYVVVDISYRDGPFPARDRYMAIEELIQSGQYGVQDARHGILFLTRGLAQPTIPAQFYSFATVDSPSPQYKTMVDFGDELRLIGFDLVWERPLFPRTYLVLYWQALRPIERDLRLFFIQTDPAGFPLPETEMEFVVPVWYRPAQWSTTEVIRTETFHWNLEPPGHFGVAVGIVDGPGFWDLGSRLQPEVRGTSWNSSLIHGNSLLWLATLNSDGQFVTLEEPGEYTPD